MTNSKEHLMNPSSGCEDKNAVEKLIKTDRNPIIQNVHYS